MKLIFFGAAKFIIPLIEMLHKNFDLALVVTTEKDPNDSLPTYCKKQNIPYISINRFSECLDEVKTIGAELGILASFGLLLPNEALNIFPKGILNIHPSLLPKYRGAMPVQTAILNGDTETGVSIIKLDEEMDHGPILGQEKEKINSDDTTATLHDRLFIKGTNMLAKILPEYVDNKLKLTEQEHSKATYTPHSLTRQDGYIDLNSLEIVNWKLEIARRIRAYYPWPTVWTRIKINGVEKIVKFLPAPPSLRGTNEVSNEAISSKYLLQVEGKKPVSLKDFINGYPELRGKIEKLLLV